MRATRRANGSRGGATPRSREFGAVEPRIHASAPVYIRVQTRVYECAPRAREGVVSYERSVISMHQFD